MMKIVLTRSMAHEDIRYIKAGLDKDAKGEYELVIPETFTEDALSEAARDADVLLGPFVTKKILGAAKSLKLIQVPWTGMDTFDFSAMQGVKIPVCNTHSNADAVAEAGITMALDLLKRVSYHDRKMRDGNWNRDQKPLGLKSRMLNGQTVCVLGYGSIGRRIGELAAAFGAEVEAVNNHGISDGTVNSVYPQGKICEAVARAGVVVCTLPLTGATSGLIDGKVFKAMKEGAVFVNLSRAAVVDEDAVWEALVSGELSAFGSDVWWNAPKRGETQCYPSVKHEFWKLDNVLLSPHRAGFVEGSLPHLDGAVENIIALVKGRELNGAVDIRRGY
ncbi:2-hydroxyacid dehydrogenase [Lachnospiraceae bacterium 48-21]